MPKLPKCKVCKQEFERKYTTTQRTCGVQCAIKDANNKTAIAVEKKRKTVRAKHRAAKQALKSKADWLREAQTACNAFIRERDKGLPCISCGNTNDVKYCAGHYKTRGAHPELRFHPYNINRQCDWNCNLNLSGNITNYRPALIEKIGVENVEWLEGDHKAQHLQIEDIKDIKQYYKEQLKLLKG